MVQRIPLSGHISHSFTDYPSPDIHLLPLPLRPSTSTSRLSPDTQPHPHPHTHTTRSILPYSHTHFLEMSEQSNASHSTGYDAATRRFFVAESDVPALMPVLLAAVESLKSSLPSSGRSPGTVTCSEADSTQAFREAIETLSGIPSKPALPSLEVRITKYSREGQFWSCRLKDTSEKELALEWKKVSHSPATLFITVFVGPR